MTKYLHMYTDTCIDTDVIGDRKSLAVLWKSGYKLREQGTGQFWCGGLGGTKRRNH